MLKGNQGKKSCDVEHLVVKEILGKQSTLNGVIMYGLLPALPSNILVHVREIGF